MVSVAQGYIAPQLLETDSRTAVVSEVELGITRHKLLWQRASL